MCPPKRNIAVNCARSAILRQINGVNLHLMNIITILKQG